MPRKTNFIPYKIKRLERYLSELEGYLDTNPLKDAENRIEQFESSRGNPIIKVISSKEQQLRAYGDTIKLLPKLYDDYNKLLASVNGTEQDELRGGMEAGDIMNNDDEDENEDYSEFEYEEVPEPKKLKSPDKLLTNNPAYEETIFDES